MLGIEPFMFSLIDLLASEAKRAQVAEVGPATTTSEIPTNNTSVKPADPKMTRNDVYSQMWNYEQFQSTRQIVSDDIPMTTMIPTKDVLRAQTAAPKRTHRTFADDSTRLPREPAGPQLSEPISTSSFLKEAPAPVFIKKAGQKIAAAIPADGSSRQIKEMPAAFRTDIKKPSTVQKDWTAEKKMTVSTFCKWGAKPTNNDSFTEWSKPSTPSTFDRINSSAPEPSFFSKTVPASLTLDGGSWRQSNNIKPATLTKSFDSTRCVTKNKYTAPIGRPRPSIYGNQPSLLKSQEAADKRRKLFVEPRPHNFVIALEADDIGKAGEHPAKKSTVYSAARNWVPLVNKKLQELEYEKMQLTRKLAQREDIVNSTGQKSVAELPVNQSSTFAEGENPQKEAQRETASINSTGQPLVELQLNQSLPSISNKGDQPYFPLGVGEKGDENLDMIPLNPLPFMLDTVPTGHLPRDGAAKSLKGSKKRKKLENGQHAQQHSQQHDGTRYFC